jgi:hypothetical protein
MNFMGVSASPILSGTDIIVVVDQWERSFIAAFDRFTGEMRWNTPRDDRDDQGRTATASCGRLSYMPLGRADVLLERPASTSFGSRNGQTGGEAG